MHACERKRERNFKVVWAPNAAILSTHLCVSASFLCISLESLQEYIKYAACVCVCLKSCKKMYLKYR